MLALALVYAFRPGDVVHVDATLAHPQHKGKRGRVRTVERIAGRVCLVLAFPGEPGRFRLLADCCSHVKASRRPCACPTCVAALPMPIGKVRSILRAGPKKGRCCRGCPGYGAGETIQRCDECWHGDPSGLTDVDVAQLPEARARLRRARRSHAAAE